MILKLSVSLILGAWVFEFIRDHSGLSSRAWQWFHNIAYLLKVLGVIAWFAYLWSIF